MESIGIRTNFKVHNIVTTYSSDAGDNPITTLAFGLVFDNPDYIPTTGTTIDGSTTTTTKAQYIRDKIAEALNSTRTENMSVFDPTETSSVVDQELRNLKITAAPVMTVSTGEIVDAITVTEVSAFAPNTSGQLVADVSLTYTEE